MKRDLQDQFNKIHTWYVGLNMKLICPPKGKDLKVYFENRLDGAFIEVRSRFEIFYDDSYEISFTASDYFCDINEISQEEVVLFLIEKDRWFQRIDADCEEISTNLKLTYPTNIIDLMSEVMKGLEDLLCLS